MERRLSAIMAADVVGYSRLMGANEVGTLTALKQHQTDFINPAIAARQGRIVKLTGDGMLVEFSSVVSAVECAVEVQRGMPERNGMVPEDRRIEFRIGINLGDVIVVDEDIFGDGVNIASRIEGVAQPGGLAVSSSVRDHIGNKLDLLFEDMGHQELKNIDPPVRVYNVVISIAKSPAAAPLGLGSVSAKPSIAVLPFTNMSDDRDQEFFSDGITEDIITDLSKISGLFVIGRNTSFTYKGQSVQLQKVAAALGVNFILEGSVRKSGDRIRVTGQLIDGVTGGHVWADRFDRNLTDIFAIQDQISSAIVKELRVKLLPDEKSAIGLIPTDNIDAYTCYLRARHLIHDRTRRAVQQARVLFARCVELDSNFARALAGVAMCDCILIGEYGEKIDVPAIVETADKALALDVKLAEGHAARGHALGLLNRDEEAEAEFERAIEFDHMSYDATLIFARYCVNRGKEDRAATLFERAIELSPDFSEAAFMLQHLLRSRSQIEKADRFARLAIRRAEEQLRVHQDSARPATLGAGALASLGETARGIEWIELALAIDPEDSNIKYNAACMWAQINEPENALKMLESWIATSGPETRRWFTRDPDFDALRGLPRFQALLEKASETS